MNNNNNNKITLQLDHYPSSFKIGAYFRQLVNNGLDPDTPTEIYRGTTLCFISPTTAGGWAKVHTTESDCKFKSNGELKGGSPLNQRIVENWQERVFPL